MGRKYFATNDTKYTQNLADYAVDINFDDLPEEVIERVKMLTLHTLGVALAAKPIALSDAAKKLQRRQTVEVEVNLQFGWAAKSYLWQMLLLLMVHSRIY